MEGYWRQGLVISLALHALILGLGGLYGLLRQPDPSQPSPIQARLVAPQAKSAQPEQQKAETKTPPEKVGKSGKEPPRTAEKAATPPPPEEPQKARKPDSATRAVAAAPEEAAEAEASAEAKTPEPPETRTRAEPEEPEVKEPEKVALKKKVAEKVPEESPEPEPKQAEKEPAKKEPAEPEEAKPGKPPAGKKAEPEEAAPDPPREKTEEPEPILSESLSDKIARLSENGEQEKASLRQRQAVARFQEVVRSRIRNQWLIPPGLGDQSGLEATVRLALTPEGKLAAPPRIVASNGPGHFNSSVLRAVRKAAPFPMPDGPTQYFQNLELHFSPDMVQ